MKESPKEIIMEEKIHITEIEELIEEEIPVAKEAAIKTVEKDGKHFPKAHYTTLLSIVFLSEYLSLMPLSILVLKPYLSLLVNVKQS
jgi:hypothetical protein